MAVDYDLLLDHVSSYVADRISPETYGPFGYTGVLPPLSNRTDFKQFPNSYYPFLGASPQVVEYFDGTIGQYHPKLPIQIAYGNRTPGIDPGADTRLMLQVVKLFEAIVLEAQRETLFELPSIIRSVNLIDCIMYPSFYAEVEGNRKYFQVAVCSLRLDLEGI